jgi:2-iminobutanoate/2-iminopropanoate deaminase
VGIDPGTGKLAEGGVAEQTRQALANVAAVLDDCGATLSDVAKTTVFLVDMGDFPVMNEVYADAFAGHRPARSTVAVAALPLGARVEVEVWAYVPR